MGDFWIALIVLTAIGCGTGLLVILMSTIQNVLTKRGGKPDQRVLDELAALREEMRQLRQVNTDLVLSLDSHVDQMAQRLERVELRTSVTGATSEQAQQTIGRSR